MFRTSLVALLALWIPSDALALDNTESTAPPTDAVEETGPRKTLFPPFKRGTNREAEAEAAAPQAEATVVEDTEQTPEDSEQTPEDSEQTPEDTAGTEGVAIDAPAVEPPADGIMSWVNKLEGEVPSEVQIAAIEEIRATETAERALIDQLSGGEPPLAFYRDPGAALAVDPLYLDRVDPSEFDIPVVVNDDVAKWVKYFTGPGRKYYARWLARSSRYRPMMYRELDKAGLPRDLVYLSMIESGYNAHAYSHAAAAGLWQFIPSTARLYKMRVDWWVDERRDPEESLRAAIDFLGELHQMFGKWELAWASYNTGPGRVRRATSRAGSEDFWVLAHGPYLHSETDNYVPKIMAAAIIGKHPERYGFTDITFQEELTYEKAKVDGSVELTVLARCAGTDVETIKALNPALRRFATPPEGYEVRLPVGTAKKFEVALAKVPKNKRVTVVKHSVKRGETLSAVASRYGVSVSSIVQANNLRNANRIYVGMSLVIPKNGVAPTTSTRTASSSSRSSAPSTYTVRSGDSLGSIANRYGTTVSSIKARNGLKSDVIHPGQKLRLNGSASSGSTASTTSYTVRRGDTLSSIASRHGVSSSDLQRWNGISNASHITVGQKLKIRGGSSGWTTYSVRGGDSLGKIATRNGCSVNDLVAWNDLSSTTIHPGQTLRIRQN